MARDYFKEVYGTGQSTSNGSTMFSDFSNHYNAKLHKCFMITSSTTISKDAKTGEVSNTDTKQLYDFNDNLQVGDYFHFAPPLGMRRCDMHGKHCQTTDEWDAWAKQYIER